MEKQFRRALWFVGLAIAILGCRVYDEQLLGPAAHGGGTTSTGLGATRADAAPPATPAGFETRCGDGVISGPEQCDIAIEPGRLGACPSACAPLAPCSQRALNGTACQAECVVLELSCGSATAAARATASRSSTAIVRPPAATA